MESYTYFRKEDECEESYGKTTLSLPALGIILVQRERERQVEQSIMASRCGVILTTDVRERMDYAWAYAVKNEVKGRRGLIEWMTSRRRA
jgi:hypothetical protein